jgi:uncharacterized protein YbjT (DUF2867 family)
MRRVLLTGATGFVGRAVHPALAGAGWNVLCATRRPEEAQARDPKRIWVRLDTERTETLGPALSGVDAVVYLIHSMGQSGDFEAKERAAAEGFRGAAEAAGVRRIVYLGGVAPAGEASKHLRSRMTTGEVLRGGRVSVIELRAAMIIGAGGLSWQMVRDLSARLPLMILPNWLQNASQPVALDDVVAAIVHAVSAPHDGSGVFDVPGPETLTGEQILKRIGKLLGIRPYTIRVPVLTPRLSSYWLKLVTRADFSVAQELVEGLTSDLVARGIEYWALMPGYQRTPFDDAALAALHDEHEGLSGGTRALEWLLQRASRKFV